MEDETGIAEIWAIYEVWKNNREVAPQIEEVFHIKTNIPSLEKIKGQLSSSSNLNAHQKHSFPRWLYDKFETDYGSETESLLGSLNKPAPVCLRVNTLKIDRKSLQARLAQEEIFADPSAQTESCLILKERKNVFTTKAFKEGLFEVQDEASQWIAQLLAPRPGERVADMCAGAGGKTLHLAALMQNKGSLLAFDISENKLNQLKIRSRRAGVSNLRIQAIQSTKDFKRHADKFDAVLIDSPCSGTGVIRRNADTKWKLTPEDFQNLLKTQEDILSQYSRLVKPGGRLLYATCSLLKDENEKQVGTFLAKNPDFEKTGKSFVRRPDKDGQDGFFAQLLTRRQ